MLSDLDTPRFTVASAADAAGQMQVNTLRSWLQSGFITLGKADASAPAGGTRLLSLRRVLQIAITVELVRRHRLAPAKAAAMALEFTDAAEGPLPDNGMTERDPGAVFGGGNFTWLVFHDQDDDQGARIVRVGRNTLAFQLATPITHHSPQPGSWLPLDPIVKSVELFVERTSGRP